MANCEGFPTKNDLLTVKQSIDHITHVSKSVDSAGVPALTVTDLIDGANVTNLTLNGLEQKYYQAIAAAGYIPVMSFENGATLTLPNQALAQVSTGSYYVWTGTFPKTVTAGSTPASSGGIGPGAWFAVGDGLLRSDLAAQNGVNLVGGAARAADLQVTNGIIDDRNYPKYNRAEELAKRLQDSNGAAVFSIDCFGDSTMWGATSGNVAVQDPNNPPSVLKTTLANLYGAVLTVNNRGISGTTLAQMLAGTDGSGSTFEAKISTTSAELIYCNHGINDSQLNNDIHQFRLNVIEFVRLCRKYGKTPILITPNINPFALGGAIITEVKSKRLEKYVQIIRDVANSVSCDLVDNYYYYQKTTRLVSPVTLVPDGAHPSSAAYRMSGRNMAIPLVSAKTLYREWDNAGLSNTTYYDNISNGRNFYESGTPFNRFNGGLTGTRSASATGLNMCVILDNPTDDTVLAMYGPQWSSGTTSALTSNGDSLSLEFSGQVNQYSFVSPLNWEACYIPEKCSMYAGLNVVGIISQSSFGGSGSDFGFSGVGLVPKTNMMSSLNSNNEFRNYPVICARSEVTLSLNLFSLGNVLKFFGCANNSSLISIDWAGNNAALTLTTNSTTYTIAAAVTTGTYPAKLKFNFDKSITVTVGIVNFTVPPGTTAYENMYISTQNIIHSIKYPL